MKKRRNPLRLLRIVSAGVFFVLFLCVILRSVPLPGLFLTQAGSDLLALAANASAGVAAALTGVLLLTLFCGRIYCSVLCPLGILQDLMSVFRLKRKYRFMPWKETLRGPLFFLILGLAVCGFLLPLTLLMPSSNFVILVNGAVKGAVQVFRRLFQDLPELQTIRIEPGVQLTAWGIAMSLFLLVLWNGRIFCNTLCPVGAALAYAAKPALFRIRLDPDKCVSCGACGKVCKASCIDVKNKRILSGECVMCMNCLDVCGRHAISLGRTSYRRKDFAPRRRDFLASAGALAGGLVLGCGAKHLPGTPAGKMPVMPPGAGTADRFSAKCVGCGLCIAACRGNVLKPALTEYGLKGFLQPVLDPYRGACEFNCTRCIEVCPCGALAPLTKEEKQSTRIGLAHWLPDFCVSYLHQQDCGACSEHCPVGAIQMVPFRGRTTVPDIDPDLCIGCGACQNICPSRPQAAIAVRGVEKQIRVEKPETDSEIKLAAEDDFPF